MLRNALQKRIPGSNGKIIGCGISKHFTVHTKARRLFLITLPCSSNRDLRMTGCFHFHGQMLQNKAAKDFDAITRDSFEQCMFGKRRCPIKTKCRT